MNNIKQKLEGCYAVDFRKSKRGCPKSIQFIVDQFVGKKWITDVEYYYSLQDNQVIVCGKTNKHHDVFYFNPLTKLLWEMGCFIHPNKHCESILGEGYIVIHIPHSNRVKEDDGLDGAEALAQIVNRIIVQIRRDKNK